MTVSSRLVMFTRFPVPGEAKTRLIPALGADQAAQLHRKLTERTLALAVATGLRVEVCTTGADHARFAKWLGTRRYTEQGAGDLGERMLRAIGEGPAIVIGCDIPGMRLEHLQKAAGLMARHDVVLGPASDGGYWLVAMNRPIPELFADIPWGTGGVLKATLERAKAAGISIVLADELCDLDTPDDLARWPELWT